MNCDGRLKNTLKSGSFRYKENLKVCAPMRFAINASEGNDAVNMTSALSERINSVMPASSDNRLSDVEVMSNIYWPTLVSLEGSTVICLSEKGSLYTFRTLGGVYVS